MPELPFCYLYSIQFINIGRVGDKSFKELRQKMGGGGGGRVGDCFDIFMLLARQKMTL